MARGGPQEAWVPGEPLRRPGSRGSPLGDPGPGGCPSGARVRGYVPSGGPGPRGTSPQEARVQGYVPSGGPGPGGMSPQEARVQGYVPSGGPGPGGMSPQEARVPGVCPLRRPGSRGCVPSGGPGPGVCPLRRPGSGGMAPSALNTALLSSMDSLGSSCPFSALALGRGQKAWVPFSGELCLKTEVWRPAVSPVLGWPLQQAELGHTYTGTHAQAHVCVCVCVCVCVHNVSSHQNLRYNSVPWTQYRVDLFFLWHLVEIGLKLSGPRFFSVGRF